MVEQVLQASGLTLRHGQLTAVSAVDISVGAGETLAIVGANGAGKSTLLRCLAGLHPAAAGTVVLAGEDITSLAPEQRVRRGLSLVPEGRRLFPSLTVEENLLVGRSAGRSGEWTLERVYELFPWMTERKGQRTGQLSGGEQQSVAIGRALVSNPVVVLLDEISLGLAPVVVQRIYATLPSLLSGGTSVLLVEQDVGQALRVADRLQCLLEGRTTLTGRPGQFSAEQVEAAYFGLSAQGVAG